MTQADGAPDLYRYMTVGLVFAVFGNPELALGLVFAGWVLARGLYDFERWIWRDWNRR